MLPSTIAEVSTLDPLLVLPLPRILPPSPRPLLQPVIDALQQHIYATSMTPVTTYTAQIRQTTRRSQALLNAAREGTARGRHELDLRDGELRGVEYERDRVRREMEQCDGYRPAFLDLDLGGMEALETDEEQAAMMTRLEDRLDQIKRREQQLVNLTGERDALVRGKKEIKQKFDAADVYVADYVKTTNAVGSKVRDVAKVAKGVVQG